MGVYERYPRLRHDQTHPLLSFRAVPRRKSQPCHIHGGWLELVREAVRVTTEKYELKKIDAGLCLAVEPEKHPYMHVNGATTALLSGVKGVIPAVLGQ